MTQIRRRFTGASSLQVESRADPGASWNPASQIAAFGYTSPYTATFELREAIHYGGRPGTPVLPLQPLTVRLFDGDTQARVANPLSLVPTGGRIAMPAGAHGLEYVPRLGVVVGRELTDATPEQALEGISAFVLMCEFSPRGVTELYGVTPVSVAEVAIPAGELVDSWNTLLAAVSVNGQVVGQARAADSSIDLGELLAGASEVQRLLPGELIGLDVLAGAAGDPLGPGDQVVVAAPRLGRLEHTIG